MTMTSLRIRKAAVLGAGVMGAQIAAHLVNADVETVLFDLPSKDGDKSAIARKAIQNLAKLSPSPLAEKARASAITPANYDEHLEMLRGCDLVIEAIAERLDWKLDLYKKIAPYLSENAVVASNTSGLSINALAEALPAKLRPRFSGIHFFNPPRYMHLVELIPDRETDRAILAGLEAFLTTTLGKGVVYAKDTPNFIGNRIGVFSILATMHHTEAFGLGFDVVDALTGPAIGRPKSATYRTADVVGLDTMAHVIKTMADTLPKDPWHRYFAPPAWLAALIEKGALGQKTGAGIYRKVGKDILVLDVARARLPAVGTRDERRSRHDPRDQGPGRKVRQAARFARSAGAIPVVDVPRPLPLRRIPSRRHRRYRARRRFRDPLGLRLEARPVRDMAGRGLAGRREVDRRRHRRRQGDERRAAARVGHGRSPRRAPRCRLVLAEDRQGRAALVASGLQAPAVSGSADRRKIRYGHDALGKRRRAGSGTSATTSASSRSRPR